MNVQRLGLLQVYVEEYNCWAPIAALPEPRSGVGLTPNPPPAPNPNPNPNPKAAMPEPRVVVGPNPTINVTLIQ